LSFSSSARRLVNVVPSGRDDLAGHEVVDRLADERVVIELAPQQLVAIQFLAAGGGEAIGLVGVVEAGERDALRKHRGGAGKDADVLLVRGRGEVRIAAEVVVFERVVPQRVAVVAAEPVSPVVALSAELRLATLGVDLARIGANPQIAAVDVDLRSRTCASGWCAVFHSRSERTTQGGDRLDHPAAVAVADVQPVIQAPPQAVDAVLLVPFAEALIQGLAHVGLAVAGRVLGIEDLRRGGDEDPLAPDLHAGGERNLVEEDFRLVVLAVAVGIGQRLHPAAGLAKFVPFLVPGDAARVIAHLHDPQPAVRPPVKRHRIDDQRLGSDQLDLEPRPDVELLPAIPRAR
jgi:hypothetical protein